MRDTYSVSVLLELRKKLPYSMSKFFRAIILQGLIKKIQLNYLNGEQRLKFT